jgi:ATP-dependent Lon protease
VAAQRETHNSFLGIEMIPNAVRIAELVIDKRTKALLMPVSARRQLKDLPDELRTKLASNFTRTVPTHYLRR